MTKPERNKQRQGKLEVESATLREELTAFVLREAWLLDDGRYEEWVSLFAEDGFYWAPAERNQESPADHVSLFYDDKPMLQVRIARLRHPQIHVQIPPSRLCHVTSEISVTEADLEMNRYVTGASFMLLEYRPGRDQRMFGGRCQHTLRRSGDSFEIVLKRVDLINCDATFPPLSIPF
jgi:3-phenylpropionate/cinnamic acid dioxygenase small subunit